MSARLVAVLSLLALAAPVPGHGAVKATLTPSEAKTLQEGGWETQRLVERFIRDGENDLLEQGITLGVDLVALSQPTYCQGYSRCVHGETPLAWAASSGNLPAARMLLKAGVPVDVVGSFNPLALAVNWERFELVQLLVQHGANVQLQGPDGRAPLFIASARQSLELTAFLLDHGANPSLRTSGGLSPLFPALGKGELLSLLLGKGADPNVRDVRGGTSLHHLCGVGVYSSGGRPGASSLGLELLTYGANVDAVDDVGETPLMCAARANATEFLTLLLQHGADVAHRNVKGETALMVAAGAGQPEAVGALLHAGASVGAVDLRGWTALHHAANGKDEPLDFCPPRGAMGSELPHMRAGHVDAADVLLRAGADHQARAGGALTPDQLAEERQQRALREGLREPCQPSFESSWRSEFPVMLALLRSWWF